ncbi:MAG TPA: DNA polymerase III subunit gamma/tau [Thermomicrobiales bacterium]|nr:DNA polymerase III subunit gamma/tau [Thermomicrobiales bacterium]
MSGPTLFGDHVTPAQEDPDGAAVARSAPASQPTGETGQTRSLYRKYRPTTFAPDDLVGQEPIVRTLQNAIARDRVAHAYLFCGPRGTGKTSTARLLAKAVNCLASEPADRPCGVCTSCRAIATGATTDVVEIDAASNRGIDDIRELRDRVNYAPTQLKTKFYIIDEAHQITGAAANAFLKTLEEPPAHTKFVLATTDPEELLQTIVSRCQRFDFRRIALEPMVARLRTIAAAEGLSITDEALLTVARAGTGSLRDAEGLLDQLSVYEDGREGNTEIGVDQVRALLGISRNDRVESLVEALAAGDARQALGTVNEAVEAGDDPRQLNRQLVAYLRVLLHERAGGSPDADDTARGLAGRFELAELASHARRFSEIDYRIRHAPLAQLPLEVALIDAILHGRPGRGDCSTTDSDASREIPTAARVNPAANGQPPRPSLRERVRGEPPASVPVQKRDPAPPSPPLRAVNPPKSGDAPSMLRESGPTAPNEDAVTVETLVELWPRIRMEVKAVNRRIEALLTSIDPVAADANQVTLAAAYEFHKNRLNADEVRQVVEEVIGRLVQRQVRITCVMRGDLAPATPIIADGPSPLSTPDGHPSPDAPVPASNPAHATSAGNGSTAGDADEDLPTLEEEERRIQAIKNILDAEEISG